MRRQKQQSHFLKPRCSSEKWLIREWRRGRDSNPRYLAVRLISNQVHSTTLPPLREPETIAHFMPWTTRFLCIGLLLILAACGEYLPFRAPLPFPTPGQHDLVVLVQPGPLTYGTDEPGSPTGLEHDLIEAFALELGVGIKYLTVEPGELPDKLRGRNYHIAAGWLSPGHDATIQTTAPIFQTVDRLAQHDSSLPLNELSQLDGKTVHALAGSRQADTLHQLAGTFPNLKVVEVNQGSILDLLEQLGNGRVDYVAIDAMVEDIATQFVPNLRTTLTLSKEQPIVWLLGTQPNAELAERLKSFVERAQHDGTLARIEERYYGHVRRLTQGDVTKFLGEIETTLPKLRRYFQAAELDTGLDWRLIAAVAYQESHWDPQATSYTKVRGIMMLTEETADRLRVTNRLDPKESILAGARYINWLKEQLEADIHEPDRTWLALAGYNLGPGNLNAGLRLARLLGADATTWYDMKTVLPKLAQPKYAQKVKAGRARGGEAVILVDNIRSYYDILLRNTAPLQPSAAVERSLKRVVAEVEELQRRYSRKAARDIARLPDADNQDGPGLGGIAHDPGLRLDSR